jgi:preprotein translocase subunit SecG
VAIGGGENNMILGMTILQFVGSIVLFILSVILVIIVLAQHGRSAYLGGAIAGGAAESFLGKNKGRTVDAMLSRFTKIIAIAFFILAILVDVAVLVFKK